MPKQFTQTQVQETIAACIGKRLSLETLKALALQSLETDGTAAMLESFSEACRAAFAEKFAHVVQPGRDSLAYMQKDKVPGVSTFYSYLSAVLKLTRKAGAGDADAMTELCALTTGKITSGKGAAGAKAAKPAADKAPEPKLLTVDDAIACLQAAHKAGALSAPQYAALQALTAPASVRNMGAAVVVEMPQLQAA